MDKTDGTDIRKGSCYWLKAIEKNDVKTETKQDKYSGLVKEKRLNRLSSKIGCSDATGLIVISIETLPFAA